MLSERAARDRIIAAAERDISALFRPLTRAVGQTVRARGGQPMTPLDRALMLRDVEQALDRVYGRFPGDAESPLLAVIVLREREGRAWVWQRSLALARSRLRGQTRLLGVLEREAA